LLIPFSVALAIKRRRLAIRNVEAWEIMTEGAESEKPNSPEKLLIDDASNFLFHAAYISYSEAFDKTTNLEGRKQLNENILALQQNKIDCQTFYRNINQYRTEDGPGARPYGRIMIKTQRKRDWRRQSQKHERIERHKK
jgi:hypothetical protein